MILSSQVPEWLLRTLVWEELEEGVLHSVSSEVPPPKVSSINMLGFWGQTVLGVNVHVPFS